MSGMDLDVVDVTPRLTQGQTSATITASTNQDFYLLGGFAPPLDVQARLRRSHQDLHERQRAPGRGRPARRHHRVHDLRHQHRQRHRHQRGAERPAAGGALVRTRGDSGDGWPQRRLENRQDGGRSGRIHCRLASSGAPRHGGERHHRRDDGHQFHRHRRVSGEGRRDHHGGHREPGGHHRAWAGGVARRPITCRTATAAVRARPHADHRRRLRAKQRLRGQHPVLPHHRQSPRLRLLSDLHELFGDDADLRAGQPYLPRLLDGCGVPLDDAGLSAERGLRRVLGR